MSSVLAGIYSGVMSSVLAVTVDNFQVSFLKDDRTMVKSDCCFGGIAERSLIELHVLLGDKDK